MNEQPTAREPSWRLRLIALASVLVVLILFIVANSTTVTIEFVIADVRTRIAWALLLSALLGFLLGALVCDCGGERSLLNDTGARSPLEVLSQRSRDGGLMPKFTKLNRTRCTSIAAAPATSAPGLRPGIEGR